jgi:hypothetical protein
MNDFLQGLGGLTLAIAIGFFVTMAILGILVAFGDDCPHCAKCEACRARIARKKEICG